MISYKLLIVIEIVLTVTTCMAYDLFFVATRLSMHYFNMSKPNGRGTIISLENITYVQAIDYDPLEKHVYWSDVGNNGRISRAKLNGDDQQVLINVQGIAVCLTLDTASRMMYWINIASSMRSDIERSKLDGTNREILIEDLAALEGYSYLRNLVLLALDTEYRKLYWFDELRFLRANLNGTDIEFVFNITDEILEHEVADRKGAALYQAVERLQWLNFTGIYMPELAAIKRSLKLFNQVSYHGDYVYQKTLNMILKSSKYEMIDSFEAVHSSQTRVVKAIKDNDQRHVLLVGNFYSILEMDTGSCRSGYDYYWKIGQDVMDNGCDYKTISISKEKLIALDYDPNNDMIYFADVNSIWNVHRNGTSERALVTSDIVSVGDLAVSSETQELFWTDTHQSVIERLNLSDGYRTIIINDNIASPKGITLDTLQRYVYWTDTVLGRIERCSFSGESRTVIVEGLCQPTALELDSFDGSIFLIDCGHNLIHVTKFSDTHVKDMNVTLYNSDISVLGDYVYFTGNDIETGRVNRTSGRIEDYYFSNSFTAFRPYHFNSDCDSTLCANGGTCVALADGYSCLCQTGFTGMTCDTYDFSVEKITPEVGPIAGGTLLTVTGRNFPTGRVRVTIGNFAECNISASNTSTLVAVTPPADGNYIGKTEPIFVLFVDHEINISSGFFFQYKQNPSVKSVHPMETLIRGGIGLTVTGDHFDAVAQPVLKVDLVIQFMRVEDDTSLLINVTSNTYYGDCEKRSVVELLCITPDVTDSAAAPHWIVGESSAGRKRRDVFGLKRKKRKAVAFLHGFRISRHTESLHRRRRREAEIKTILDIYIGVILDGVKKYDNLSANADTEQYGKLTIIKAPHFTAKPISEGINFKPGQQLDIEGKDVNKLSMEDYKVDVGKGQCDILEITSNKLICMPPQREPPRAERSRTEGHLIVVHIGRNLEEIVGALIYPIDVIRLIGIGSGIAAIILICIAVTAICLRRKSQNRKRRAQRDTQSDANNDVDSTSVIRLPPVKPDFFGGGNPFLHRMMGVRLHTYKPSHLVVMPRTTARRRDHEEAIRKRRQHSRRAARRQIESMSQE